MLARDSVKSRLDSDEGCSFTELAYQTLQSYDFLHLYREHGCILQLGGSDQASDPHCFCPWPESLTLSGMLSIPQWGNITAGIDLIRRHEASPAYGVTLPLLTTEAHPTFAKPTPGSPLTVPCHGRRGRKSGSRQGMRCGWMASSLRLITSTSTC